MLLVLGCNPGGENSTGFTTQPGTTAPMTTEPDDTSDGSSTGSSSTSTSTSGGSSTDSSAGASASSGTVWDMGAPPDFDPTPPGCQGKIDFLFIVSRDDFMKPHQDQLVAAFPQFIETIQSQFSDFDVHILVTDSDPDWHSSWCEDDCGDNMCEADPAYPCDYWPTACDQTMGAGVVMNVGPYTEDKPCLDGPLRYITADTPDLPGTFECLARVGASGYNMLGDALVGAMSYKLNKVGGCNEGFIREDALLMVTIIGPEDSPGGAESQGTWQQWMQAVVDRKKGNLDAIVMFGLTDDCIGTNNPDFRLCMMIPKFPHSLLDILTTPDYGPVFDDAATLALEACSAFVPG